MSIIEQAKQKLGEAKESVSSKVQEYKQKTERDRAKKSFEELSEKKELEEILKEEREVIKTEMDKERLRQVRKQARVQAREEFMKRSQGKQNKALQFMARLKSFGIGERMRGEKQPKYIKQPKYTIGSESGFKVGGSGQRFQVGTGARSSSFSIGTGMQKSIIQRGQGPTIGTSSRLQIKVK